MKKIIIFSFIFIFLFSVKQNQTLSQSKEIDFGDGTSKTLTSKAWKALEEKNYEAVLAYTSECMKRYGRIALQQQQSLTKMPEEKNEIFAQWALNDVATCLFIRGKALIAMGNKKEAKKAFNTIIKKLPFAQCWDPQGWFWKVADAAKDQMLFIEKNIEITDYKSSSLISNAWQKFNSKDYESAIIYAKKCIELYEKEALKQQSELKGFLPKEKAFDAWALNDVGTAYFIIGESLTKQGKYKEAYEAFKTLSEKFKYSQCWDPNGWFWKPAKEARKRMQKLRSMH